MTEKKKNFVDVPLTKEEEKLIEEIRKIDFGEARVVITDGKPTRIEEIKKSIKLQENKMKLTRKLEVSQLPKHFA